MPVTKQDLQQVIWNIQKNLPPGYGVRLSWPHKKVYLIERCVYISQTEQWASALYVDNATKELTPKKLDKLYTELQASYKRVMKNDFTPDENLSFDKAQQLLALQ